MNAISLFHIIGKSSVDDPLSQTIRQYELTFPNRIRGYYLLGSYASGHAVIGSDIDMYILFKEGFPSSEESARAKQLALSCAQRSSLRLEINVVSEQSLADYHSIMRAALKRNSILLYGKDTRASMTLPSREAYRRDATDGVLEFLFRLHRLDVVTYPLDYPDPNGMFYGYDHLERLRFIDRPYDAPPVYYATRELVECACRMATALLALKTESFVGTKWESVQTYHTMINDTWSPFLTAMFEKGKMQWAYGLPERKEERAELRMLCEQMLPFENHYLLHYRNYLLTLLQSGNEQAMRFAAQRLKMVLFNDEEMITAVQALDNSDAEELRREGKNL